MNSFQRARNEEQREVRRRSILETAATMLSEMPVSAMSLNELSRRVGLAKSNVMRYFESREAVLLDLLESLTRDFLAEVVDQLPACVDRSGSAIARAEAVASGLAASFASRKMLCELLSAQAGILEHNVSAEVAARYKRGAHDGLAGLAGMLQEILPELGDRAAAEAASMTIVLVGALWTHSHPAAAVRAAYATDPSLVFLRTPFAATLERSITIFLIGLLADSDR
ncbi:TetR/AcrR family transcriptional regulator [Streptomyces hyaluromycini]|uniref:TetR/AcrR family transcriptional regulator n=1 Tax=Streptomyces hyaluromycini TaxID=1377993 RepID=A0ABV1X037_9ACTN